MYRKTECVTCHARGLYVPENMFSTKGSIVWTAYKQEYSEPWCEAQGYLPTLCKACADKRCPHCGR